MVLIASALAHIGAQSRPALAFRIHLEHVCEHPSADDGAIHRTHWFRLLGRLTESKRDLVKGGQYGLAYREHRHRKALTVNSGFPRLARSPVHIGNANASSPT